MGYSFSPLPAKSKPAAAATPKAAPKPKGRAPGKGSKKGKHKSKENRTWSLYIFKVLKQVHHDQSISNKAMHVVNSFVSDVFERLASKAGMTSLLFLMVWLTKISLVSLCFAGLIMAAFLVISEV